MHTVRVRVVAFAEDQTVERPVKLNEHLHQVLLAFHVQMHDSRLVVRHLLVAVHRPVAVVVVIVLVVHRPVIVLVHRWSAVVRRHRQVVLAIRTVVAHVVVVVLEERSAQLL